MKIVIVGGAGQTASRAMKRALACVRCGASGVEIDVDGQLFAAGPADLLLASLAACTALTLRDCAAARRWPLATLDVYLTMEQGAGGVRIERRLFMTGIDPARQAILLDLAAATPVTLLLAGSVAISTMLL